MAQSTPQLPKQPEIRRAGPTILPGADDQAAAYEALLAHWQDVDPEQDERDWQRIQAALQETRRALQQRPLFAA
jgi:hypothetical protein